MKRTAAFGIVFAILTTSAGCNRGAVVRDEKVYETVPGQLKIYFVPACKQLEVALMTTDNVPVNVSIVSKADGEDAEKSDTTAIKGKKLASKDNVTNDKLTYAANDQPTAIVIDCKKKTTVTVKITGD